MAFGNSFNGGVSSLAAPNLTQITSATKPTTRVGGTALVVGDVWINPTAQTQGFWNGTYWVSAQKSFETWFDGVPIGTLRMLALNHQNDILFESNTITFAVLGTVNNASNYWQVQLANLTLSLNNTSCNTSALTFAASTAYKVVSTLNIFNSLASFSSGQSNNYYLGISVVGSPSNIFRVAATLLYREVYR